MLRMSRLTDYGIVLLAHLAGDERGEVHNARELAAESALPMPVVSKILKGLARGGLLVSHRGIKGGYALARAPEHITVAEVIDVLEGPIALTECGAHPGHCAQEASCRVRDPWQRINRVVRDTLARITLADLVHESGLSLIPVESLFTVARGTQPTES